MLHQLRKSVSNGQSFRSLLSQYLSQRFRHNRSDVLRSRHRHRTSATSGSPEDSLAKTQRNENVDYLGISAANHREVSGLYDSDGTGDDVIHEYSDLLLKKSAKMSDENLLVTTFGRVRLDSLNEPSIHGQYDEDNERPKFDIKEFESKLSDRRVNTSGQQNQSDCTSEDNNFIDGQYFGGVSTGDRKKVDDNSSADSHTSGSDFGFIDKQFFAKNTDIKPLIKSKIDFKFSSQFNEFLEQKAVDEQNMFQNFRSFENKNLKAIPRETDGYESGFEDNLEIKCHLITDSPLKPELFSSKFESNIDLNPKATDEVLDENNEIKEKIAEQREIKLEEYITKPADYSSKTRTGAQYLNDVQSGAVSPQYPHKFTDEVKNYRSQLGLGKEKLDSKGFRILSGQVFDYTKFTKEDIIELLVKSILFDDNHIVAINKPYGMSVHTKESPYSPVLTEFLPQLTEKVNCHKLYTVHRLDRDTTGVLLLAKTQEMAKRLNQMFCEQQIIKRYLCVTRGVPDNLEGIIDIPLEMGRCEGKERMVLRPEALEEYKHKVKSAKFAKRAVTQYKVVSQYGNAALIEVWPKTGIRHQIRVHLGFGLRCPVLGDHKYSHLDKIAPQKLTADMLLALNVRQAKVRHIPMHLHARQYLLPSTGHGGRNIFINAPIPHHFHKNLAKLKLQLKSNVCLI